MCFPYRGDAGGAQEEAVPPAATPFLELQQGLTRSTMPENWVLPDSPANSIHAVSSCRPEEEEAPMHSAPSAFARPTEQDDADPTAMTDILT